MIDRNCSFEFLVLNNQSIFAMIIFLIRIFILSFTKQLFPQRLLDNLNLTSGAKRVQINFLS